VTAPLRHEEHFRNPILPGSHPDPSICRVDDDYYIVTSSFEYFPGLPLFHSRDLVNWRPLGHVLTRPEQLNLDGIGPSRGLFAPTIRHDNGVFYVTCTLVDGSGPSGNFIVTADDPGGPWSDPIWIDGADGFDPSLFFDNDGSLWFCATTETDPADRPGRTTVWLQELDRLSFKLVGSRFEIWTGAMRDAAWAEAPHVYRIGDTYYLVTAEGGTSFEHAVVVARSDHVSGPYVGCPRNPVLTARHLGPNATITATGHADLVQTPDGSWWAVLLGVRDHETGCLGRETFLTPVEWDAEWPVFSPGAGRVRLHERRPELPNAPWPTVAANDSFDATTLGPSWMFVRTPREQWWSLTQRLGHLRLQLRPETLADQANPSFVARRLQHRNFSAHTGIDFEPELDGDCAGLAVYHSGSHHFRFEVAGVGRRVARVIRRLADVEEIVGQCDVETATVRLGVEGRQGLLEFRIADGAGNWHLIAQVDSVGLSASVAGGFFGVLIGVFGTSSGVPTTAVADFDGFEYMGVGPCG
jgi:xylan 1,4-beta-xylosidase